MKTTLLFMLLLMTFTSYGQITTTNRNIKEEVTNVDATNISNDITNNSNNTLLLKKTANSNIVKQISGDWSKANEKDDYHNFITIPKIAFPGYVKVTLKQGHKKLRPAMVISPDFNKGGAIISGSSIKTRNKLNRTAYFSVHPGESYSVRVYPFFNAKTYPRSYDLKWEFIGKRDIYEPNDLKSEAKLISFNEPIKAYAIVGHIKYYISTYDENTYDWYKVNLDDYKKINIKILDRPNDLELNIRIIDAAGRQVGTVITRDYTNSFNTAQNRKSLKVVTTRNNLTKGTYYLEVHPRMNGPRKSNNDTEPVPEHFKKPYKLVVTKK